MTGSPGRTQRTVVSINKLLISLRGFDGDAALMSALITLLWLFRMLVGGAEWELSISAAFWAELFQIF